MATQQSLFDGVDLMVNPLSRKSDPATSREAAKRMVETGKLTCDKERVLRALRTWYAATGEPITAGELAHEYSIGPSDAEGYSVCHKRLPGLREDGLVETCEARECRIRKNRCQTWRPSSC